MDRQESMDETRQTLKVYFDNTDKDFSSSWESDNESGK